MTADHRNRPGLRGSNPHGPNSRWVRRVLPAVIRGQFDRTQLQPVHQALLFGAQQPLAELTQPLLDGTGVTCLVQVQNQFHAALTVESLDLQIALTGKMLPGNTVAGVARPVGPEPDKIVGAAARTGQIVMIDQYRFR